MESQESIFSKINQKTKTARRFAFRAIACGAVAITGGLSFRLAYEANQNSNNTEQSQDARHRASNARNALGVMGVGLGIAATYLVLEDKRKDEVAEEADRTARREVGDFAFTSLADTYVRMATVLEQTASGELSPEDAHTVVQYLREASLYASLNIGEKFPDFPEVPLELPEL